MADRLHPLQAGAPMGHSVHSKIYALQVLRFLAALAVAVWHLPASPLNALSLNTFGVDVFFVISGFIICLVADGRRPAEFMWDRIARVVPLYWLLTFAVVMVAVIEPTLLKSTIAEPALVLQSLLFVPFVKANLTMQPVLFVGWTLNYEMFFYALFALCLFAGRCAPIVMLVVLGTLALLGRLVGFEAGPLRFWTAGTILEFGYGILLCLAWRRWRFPGWLALLAPLGLLLEIAEQLWPSGLPSEVARGIPAALIVAGALALRIENRGLWVPLIALGNASYSLYLSHPYVLSGADLLVRQLGLGEGVAGIVADLAGLVLASLVGLLLYRVVERPLQRLLQSVGPVRIRPIVAGGPQL